MNSTKAALVALCSVVLAACGGGGGDSAEPASAPASGPAVGSANSFALQAGYKARVAGGVTDNFAISGSCSGTAVIAIDRATASTFEGTPGYTTTQSATVNLSNCTVGTNPVVATSYFDLNYAPIGGSITGIEYTKYLTVPSAFPASVKVGDSATVGTSTVYSNSSKTTVLGTRQLSYLVEANTATTAFITLTTKSFDVSNQLVSTELAKYQIAGDGTLSIVSIDVQFTGTNAIHLRYTKT
jgi:hypothetical protein